MLMGTPEASRGVMEIRPKEDRSAAPSICPQYSPVTTRYSPLSSTSDSTPSRRREARYTRLKNTRFVL